MSPKINQRPQAMIESEANKSMFYEFDYTQEQNKGVRSKK